MRADMTSMSEVDRKASDDLLLCIYCASAIDWLEIKVTKVARSHPTTVCDICGLRIPPKYAFYKMADSDYLPDLPEIVHFLKCYEPIDWRRMR